MAGSVFGDTALKWVGDFTDNTSKFVRMMVALRSIMAHIDYRDGGGMKQYERSPISLADIGEMLGSEWELRSGLRPPLHSHHQKSVTYVVAQLVTHVVTLDSAMPLHRTIRPSLSLERTAVCPTPETQRIFCRGAVFCALGDCRGFRRPVIPRLDRGIHGFPLSRE